MLPFSYLIWKTAATTGGLFNFLHSVFIFHAIYRPHVNIFQLKSM